MITPTAVIKFTYIIFLLAFAILYIIDFIEINSRGKRKKNKYKI